MTIFGASASVTSIIQVLAKVVHNLSELHNQWKQADFTFVNLIAQLTALKAALNKLQEWMDADMESPHHQLVMDLELSITCCRMLVSKMDCEVSELRQNENDGLDMQSKMKLVVRNRTLEDLQKMAERQTNALTLLLTVCNW
jgi:guanine nucleotide-binding protein G(i) subunit alpha